MNAVLLRYGNTLYAWFRGDAPPVSGQQLSLTINLARICLIVGLVFLHYKTFPNSTASPFDGLDPQHHPLATFVNSTALFFFFSAVPLLSMISGWLFFSFRAHGAVTSLYTRVRRRVFSLYLPMVFWNAAFLAVLLVLFAWQPGHLIFDQLNLQFANASGLDYVNAVFAITERPIGFQFWFIRDLFVTVLVSPLLWLSLRYLPYVGMAVLAAAWLVGADLVVFFRPDVLFFFYLGGFLRLRNAPLEIGLRSTMVLIALYVLLVVLRALAPMAVDIGHPRPELLTLGTRALRLIGVLACWGMALHLGRTRLGGALARYGGFSFFLYAAHFPLLAQVKIVLWRWVPAESDAWMIVHYLLSVAATVVIAFSLGLLLARAVPNWFAAMNGGRIVFAEPRRLPAITPPVPGVVTGA